ncbi:MAG: TetR family transcriptional regulator, partial [Myxococcales bacterium]|nr:TetR family transcriptional regulator [Myxococcales bacterium]
MARTRSAAYEDKQQSILDGAALLFARHGFAKTTIESLARSMNASKARIYHYYPSKEALLYAVLEEHILRLRRLAGEATATDGTPEERLRRVVHALMAAYVHSTEKHVVLMNELAYLPEEQRQTLRALQKRLVDDVQSLVVELRPQLADDDARRRPLAMSLMGLINWTYTWFHADGPLSAEQFADLATDLFFEGPRGSRIGRRTAMKVMSYAMGEWFQGRGDGKTVLHAVTGEPVAAITTDGLDFGAMVEFGKKRGGPSLRKMSFHERGRMLKALASALMERKARAVRALVQ